MTPKEITLGIDIGGTNTVLGFVDRDGRCFAETSLQTNAHESADNLVQRLSVKIHELRATLTGEYTLIGIGVGAPNANYYRGTVEDPPNLSWKGITPLAAMLKECTGLPVAITNDANAAALGEMQFGAARGMRNFIVITLGTGLGSGIVANGELVYGSDGFAGELGHTLVDPEGRRCGCGKRGCLETYASAAGICRTAFELMSAMREDSPLRGLSFNQLTAKMITEAALEGDVLALAAFEYTGRILGMKLADSVLHTSPEAIIFFGGLANAGELIFKPTKRYLEQYLMGIFRDKVKLLPSNLPQGNAAVLGAGALIWTELLRAR